jgi:hypothetical protein
MQFHFRGVKGRFCQPRPKAWEIGSATRIVGPVRAVNPSGQFRPLALPVSQASGLG